MGQRLHAAPILRGSGLAQRCAGLRQVRLHLSDRLLGRRQVDPPPGRALRGDRSLLHGRDCLCFGLLGTLLRLLPGSQERGIIPLVHDETPVAQLPYLGRQPVHQVAVVRNQQDRPIKVLQRFLQRLLCGQVEMIGRLVEQHQVRLFQREDRQGQAAALAAAQRADRLEHIVSLKEIARQDIACLRRQHPLV